MGRAEVQFYFEVNGEDVEIEATATFSPVVPAYTSGPPDRCHPAEGGEIDDITFSRLIPVLNDAGKVVRHRNEPCSEATLYELLIRDNPDWDMDKARDHVEEVLVDHYEDDEPDYPDYDPEEYY